MINLITFEAPKPALPFGSIQFNNAGAFGGFGNWDGTRMLLGDESAIPPDIQDWGGAGLLYIANTNGSLNGLAIESAGKRAIVGVGYADAITGGQAVGINISSLDAGGPVTSSYASFATAYITGGANKTGYGVRFKVGVSNVAVSAAYATYGGLSTDSGGSIVDAYVFYSEDIGTITSTNPYYSWFDSRGVLRVKEDSTFNSVGQAITALYNPQFTKYTPGAANFERVILGQWNSNVAEIGTEAGGTGVLRDLRLIGTKVQFNGAAVPTSSDGAALGSTSLMWSDLFLASGGVINWNNGNATITHSTGLLTFNGPVAGTQLTLTGDLRRGAGTTYSLDWSPTTATAGATVLFFDAKTSVGDTAVVIRRGAGQAAHELLVEDISHNVYFRVTGGGTYARSTINVGQITGTSTEVNLSSAGRIDVKGASGIFFAAASASQTAGIARNADGVVEVFNGTQGQWGSLLVGTRDAGTATVTNGITVGHQSTGTPAAGLGSAVLFNINSTTTADQNAAQIAALWTTATHASRTADIVFYAVSNAAALAEVARISAAGAFNAASFKVGGVAGADFGPGLPTSITVVKGIITAIS